MEPHPSPRSADREWFENPLLHVGITAILVSGLWAGLTLIPVEHRLTENFTIWGSPSGGGCGVSRNISTPSPGRFAFSWHANESDGGFFSVIGAAADIPETYQPYSEFGENGSGNISLTPGLVYYLQFCGAWDQTATGRGILSYSVPVISAL